MREPRTLLASARAMRREPTHAERLLWRHLQACQLAGFKFRRQEVLGRYIVDFVCLDAKLIVEADGGQHADRRIYNGQRSADLAGMGYTILRFWNNEVLGDIDGVLERVRAGLLGTPHPGPLPGGEGD